MRRLALIPLVLVASCAVDTELGLDATIDAASVLVAADDSVVVSVDLTYRVGAYAEATHRIAPQAIVLFVADSPVVSLVPRAPPGFVGTVRPGESFMTTLQSTSTTATDPRRMCGAEVRVLFRWVDGSTMEIGMTDSTTSDVTCS